MSPVPIPRLVVAVVALAVPACHPHEDHHAPEARTIVVTRPVVKDVTVTQQYVCQIRSRRHIKVRAIESGYLEAISVREGQAVKQGDLLFQVVPVLFKARLEAEQAEVRLADLKLRNTERLRATNVVSEQEVLLVQAELAKAQAKLKLAQAELDFATIRAPFDGIINRLEEQQGSLVKEEAVLTTLSDNAVMWVYFNVPEARYLEYMARWAAEKKAAATAAAPTGAAAGTPAATGTPAGGDSEQPIPVAELPAAVTAAVAKRYPGSTIHKAERETEDGRVEYEVEIVTADGRRIELEFDPDGRPSGADDGTHIGAGAAGPTKETVELVLADGSRFPHPGTIGAIEADFDNETGNIPFRADFPNPDRLLRNGQTGTVLLRRTLRDAVVIPQRATFEVLDKQFVWVIGEDRVARQRLITVEHELEDVFVLRSGLGPNDAIVLEGVRDVRDGDKVGETEFVKPEDSLAHQKQHAE